MHRPQTQLHRRTSDTLAIGFRQKPDPIRISFSHRLRPCDVFDASDNRLLFIAVIELTLTPLGGAAGDMRELANIQFSGEEVARSLRQQRDADAQEVNNNLQTEGPNARSLTMMIESHVRGVGAVMHIRPRLRDAITARANREAPDAPPIFDWHRLRTEGVEHVTPSLARLVLRRSDYDSVPRFVLLPPTRTTFMSQIQNSFTLGT